MMENLLDKDNFFYVNEIFIIIQKIWFGNKEMIKLDYIVN